MTAVRRLTTMTCVSLLATSLFAQTGTTPTTTNQARRTTDAVTAETDRDAADPRALRLSLREALQTAAERNLGIQLQGFDYRMAGESLRSQYGYYDWFAQGTLAQTSSESPVASTQEASLTKRTTLNFGVAQNLPTGGDYFLGLNNQRNNAVGAGRFLNPTYDPALIFTATQPLLRNFGLDINRRTILIARNTLGINRELFRTALMDTVSGVEQAYLDLVYSRRAVEVVKESLFLARDQARITQIRIDVGASAPLDILQPRVTIATTEEQLISAVANVRAAEDRLRALLNLDRSDWARPIVPTDPVEYTPMTVSAEAAVNRAFELRPELRQAQFTTDTRRVQYNFARNQVLPQLDFDINFRAAGLGVQQNGFDPVTGAPLVESRLNPALQEVFSAEFPTWTFSLNAGVPITNIGARAERRRAELDLASSRMNQEQVRQNIMLNVRTAARNVETAASLIAATRTARDAAERNLEAERRRYENGMTTNFQVLQIQQQLSDARVRELQALVGYNQAVAAYHREVGDILEFHNITVDEPEISPEPRVFSQFDRYNWMNYGSDDDKDDEVAPK
jgi:HAE1 family hydrophobic/amphiphilic exporter-1